MKTSARVGVGSPTSDRPQTPAERAPRNITGTLSPSPKLSASATTPDVRTTRPALRTGSFGDGENALGGESKPGKHRRRVGKSPAKAGDTRFHKSAGDARPPFDRDRPAPHPAIDRLRQRVADNTCPISGLSDTEFDEHIDGITRLIGNAKGWDRIRAEYGDVLGEARHRTRRACTVCGKPTRALSQVCPGHELDHEPFGGDSDGAAD